MAYREKVQSFSVASSTGLLSQGGTAETSRDIFYELELAIVVKIYSEIPGKIQIFSLFSQKQLDCLPLNQNVKVVPTLGELVVFREYKLGRDFAERQYFYEPLSWNGSIHSNDFPDTFMYILEGIKKNKQPQINTSKVSGEVEKLKLNDIGLYYKKDLNSYNKNLIHFEGNVLFEGRNGQSVRFGSTIPKSVIFEQEIYKKSNWYYSKNETKGGKPFIIISNGKTNTNETLCLEDIQNDPATIFFANGGEDGTEFPFLLSAIKYKPAAIKIPNSYNDNIILVNSDRLIFNTKYSDIILSSNNDIIEISNNATYIKAGVVTELAAPTINLGENAKKEGQSVVKDKDLMNFLSDMIDAISSLQFYNGPVVPGTDTKLKLLQSDLQKAIKNTANNNVFSSETTFTL